MATALADKGAFVRADDWPRRGGSAGAELVIYRVTAADENRVEASHFRRDWSLLAGRRLAGMEAMERLHEHRGKTGLAHEIPENAVVDAEIPKLKRNHAGGAVTLEKGRLVSGIAGQVGHG